MTTKTINVQDRISFEDAILSAKKPGFRTRIIGGYDKYTDKNGKTRFGTVAFEEENITVLGGSLYTLSKLFQSTPTLVVPPLTRLNSPAITTTPIGTNHICLFGVGYGGASDSLGTSIDPNYYDYNLKKQVPFRYTNEIDASDMNRYWARKVETISDVTRTSYYLKTFDNAPVIKVEWENTGLPVTTYDLQLYNGENAEAPNSAIDTYIELELTVNKYDIREYFTASGDVELPRINEFGIYSAVMRPLVENYTGTPSTHPANFEYTDISLFSKFTVENEYLRLPKDLTVVYQIFSS